jgi:hypothetical protein
MTQVVAFPYYLRSRVSVNDFGEFVSALKDATIKVTNNSFKGL